MVKNKYHNILISGIVLSLILTGILFFFYQQFTYFTLTPHDAKAKQQIFIISPGQTLKTVAYELENRKIIASSRLFIWLTKYKKAGKKIQAGEYLISGAQSPEKILMTLLSGKVKLYKLTIPEGFNIKETGKRVETAGFCTMDEFVTLCNNPVFIRSQGVQANTLEGYLFPDTYFFPKQADCQAVINAMVKRFRQIFSQKWQDRAKELGFSVFEIVTLASIIEKETGDASERPIIASVFHNRLKKRMRLESDPTVIYGIKDYNGNIQRKHLRAKTPYNTYQIKGLPVGPIANPGALSIQAALFPLKTDYIFFVSKKDTTHYFSKTIQEHNRAVRKYQLRKK